MHYTQQQQQTKGSLTHFACEVTANTCNSSVLIVLTYGQCVICNVGATKCINVNLAY
jgi:hypothetical protein